MGQGFLAGNLGEQNARREPSIHKTVERSEERSEAPEQPACPRKPSPWLLPSVSRVCPCPHIPCPSALVGLLFSLLGSRRLGRILPDPGRWVLSCLASVWCCPRSSCVTCQGPGCEFRLGASPVLSRGQGFFLTSQAHLQNGADCPLPSCPVVFLSQRPCWGSSVHSVNRLSSGRASAGHPA